MRTKIKTQAAQCAIAIRKELKEKFPGVKFKVTSESFAGGNSVRVSFVDSKYLQDEVESEIKKYQYGHFDGMTDYYEHSNVIEGLPQTKYLFVDRKYSNEIEKAVAMKVCKEWNIEFQEDWYSIRGQMKNGRSIPQIIRLELSDSRF